MNRVRSLVLHSAVILALWLGSAGQVAAGPLDPLAFTPIGPFPTVGGTYTFNTSGPTPSLTGPGGTLDGVVFNGIAVFDFTAITVGSNQIFLGNGTSPLALLSRGGINVNGTIDVSAPSGSPGIGFFNPGGPGGFANSSGPGAGGNGNAPTSGALTSPGGGGFGGQGGNGGFFGPPPAARLSPSGAGSEAAVTAIWRSYSKAGAAEET
jgi:hypothetical protein